ncbi:porin family protein [Flavobacterium rhizosphaerae]|uniref:Porin family protein n=1 Tax=Flavobacterium rhizosphaerae TaxID=3163298 RepID=A0ABW8YZT0_9FLAO
MKKLIVIAFLSFAFFKAGAQITVTPGVRAGLNLSTFTNFPDSQTRTDFYAGGFVGIKFVKFYTLQPEITYSRQGTKYNYDSSLYLPEPGYEYHETQEDLQIQYLSFALINKFTFKGFAVMVGPSIDFKVGDNFEELSDELEGFDLTLQGGLGYEFGFGMGIEARYKIGLVDIFGNNFNGWDDDDDYYNDDIDDVRLNSVVQIGLTYSF